MLFLETYLLKVYNGVSDRCGVPQLAKKLNQVGLWLHFVELLIRLTIILYLIALLILFVFLWLICLFPDPRAAYQKGSPTFEGWAKLSYASSYERAADIWRTCGIKGKFSESCNLFTWTMLVVLAYIGVCSGFYSCRPLHVLPFDFRLYA